MIAAPRIRINPINSIPGKLNISNIIEKPDHISGKENTLQCNKILLLEFNRAR